MARVIWSRRALRDLASITDHISLNDKVAARRLSVRIDTLGDSLCDFPNRGRPVGRFREMATVPPFVLRYEVMADTVEILTIRHGRRRPLSS